MEIVTDNSGMLQAIYYQDAKMQQTQAKFPEILLLDATYKLNDLRMSLYLLMPEDRQGETVIIALWVFYNEDKDTISALMDAFIAHNNTDAIQCVMADKDMVEHAVIREKIPHAPLLICLFHVLRTFRCEVTTEKLGISAHQRLAALEVLRNMAYAKDEETYQDLY